MISNHRDRVLLDARCYRQLSEEMDCFSSRKPDCYAPKLYLLQARIIHAENSMHSRLTCQHTTMWISAILGGYSNNTLPKSPISMNLAYYPISPSKSLSVIVHPYQERIQTNLTNTRERRCNEVTSFFTNLHYLTRANQVCIAFMIRPLPKPRGSLHKQSKNTT